MKVAGLVIGTRKAGTTWIYQNLVADNRFCVSEKVKESGFFAGILDCSFEEYLGLYPERGDGFLVEVDASVCYSDRAPAILEAHSGDTRIILILRDPVEYLVSRFVHSQRKGEIRETTLEEAVDKNDWLKNELDYESILNRFSLFRERGQVLIMSFSDLEVDPVRFYDRIVAFITGNDLRATEVPIADRANVARDSRFPMLSRFFSDCAKYARGRRLHWLVNLAKKTGILKLLEKSVADSERDALYQQAIKIIDERFQKSYRIWHGLTGS